MEIKYYKNAAKGRWFQFSPVEQMANIGSEVSRAKKWQGKNELFFREAIERALELFDLTLADERWFGGRLRELARVRELFCDAVDGGKEYGTSLEDLERYFLPFAFAARRNV